MSLEERPPESPDPTARLVGWLEAVPDLANADEHLVHRGRYVTLSLLVGIGERRCYLPIAGGRVGRVDATPQRMRSAAFAVHAPPQSWERFWQPMPRPGWHDLFAMNKRGEATIEGNLEPFMQNLQYFKDLFALPRRLGGRA